MHLRTIPVMAAALGLMAAAPAIACEGHEAAVAHSGHDKGAACENCACGEDCACPMCAEKGEHDEKGDRHEHHGEKHRHHGEKHHGDKKHHGGKSYHGYYEHHAGAKRHHRFERASEVRYQPAMGATTNQHLILAGGPRMSINEWASIGWQQNLGIQLGASAPNAGPWVTPYGGFLPRVGTRLGGMNVHAGALVGAGAMLRTTDIPNVGSDFLQTRLMWTVEPRVELGWEAGTYRGALVATYLLTPQMTEIGGATVGLQWSFKGMPFKHW